MLGVWVENMEYPQMHIWKAGTSERVIDTNSFFKLKFCQSNFFYQLIILTGCLWKYDNPTHSAVSISSVHTFCPAGG